MRIEQVEIYSDASNMAVMRHPGRRFPGMLIQGDTLHNLCQTVERLCSGLGNNAEARELALELQEELQDRLDHYKTVLIQHGIPMPFHEGDGIG